MIELNKIYNSDCLTFLIGLPDNFIDCCVTSPPYYGLRDYGVDGQLGLESTPEEYVSKLVQIFSRVKRVLKPEGTLWLNLGDSYANNGCNSSQVGGSTGERIRAGRKGIMDSRPRKIPVNVKPKDLIGIPWMVAFALRADGWYLRQDIIWHKPNPMPESVTDRCTKSHEYIFLLSKSQKYYYDQNAIKDPQVESSLQRLKKGWNGNGDRAYPDGPQNHIKNYMGKTDEEIEKLRSIGANKRSVWTVPTMPYSEAHFATFPEKLIVPCIKAGCPEGGIVLDPFMGAGTTALVSHKLNRNYLGCDINSEYCTLAEKRIKPHKMQTKILFQ